MLEPFDLPLLGLAAWRLASLFACEAGPFDALVRLRHWVGVRYASEPPYEPVATNAFAKGLVCVWCSSVWFAALLSLGVYLFPPTRLLAFPLAVSALAIGWETWSRK